jgi:nucleoside phosphorylase
VHLRFVSAIAEELSDLPGHVLGIGPYVSAVRTAQLVARDPPAAIVWVGTAGRYPGGPPVGSVILGGRLGLGDGAARAGLGYVPGALPPIEAGEDWLGTGLPRASVLTLPAITSNLQLARQFAQDGWQAETMETFLVAWVCAEARVPFAALLGLTNDVGPNAHEEWRKNRDDVQAEVRAVARTLLR